MIRLSTITIISAIEFWFTKNVLGRVLVGLRWNRVILDNGEEEYTYETKRDESTNHPLDSKFFWGYLSIAFLIWAVLALLNLLSITNLLIISVPLVLLGTNLYSYYKCSSVQKENVKNFLENQKGKATQEAVNYGLNNYDKI